MTPSGDSSDTRPPSGGSSPDTMTPSGDSYGMPPSGGSSTDTMTPSGDSSPDTMHSNAHNSETDTAGEVTGFENPWELNEFFQSYNTVTFMPNQISLGFLKAVSQHTNALYCKAKALVDMKKKTNEDATKIYKAMYKFLASDEHSRMCGKLKDSPKPQKLSAKLLIWLLGTEFNRIASEITETQAQAIDGMPEPTVEISSAAGAKIRYIAGACLHKILSQLRTIVQKNMGIATKKGEAQRFWNYKLQRLLKGSELQKSKSCNQPHYLTV